MKNNQLVYIVYTIDNLCGDIYTDILGVFKTYEKAEECIKSDKRDAILSIDNGESRFNKETYMEGPRSIRDPFFRLEWYIEEHELI